MKVHESPYARLSTDDLWVLRDTMERGVAQTGERFAAGEQMREGEIASLQLRVTQVEAIDAVLLSRDVAVAPPFWED